jgi:hypothetical protein
LLIIDDLALQPTDATDTANFCELVVARHHNTSTVLTSKRGPDEWLAMMSDALLGAVVDRFASTTPRTGHRTQVLPPTPKPSVDTSTDRRHHDR